MATDIDSLQIQINATATKANNSIDKLVGKLDRLSNSLQGLQTGNLSNLSSGVQQLGTAMQSMNAVKTADFTRLAKNLNNLATVDSAKIGSLATSIERIGRSFPGLSGVSSSASQMADLAKAISQLGYKSATQAITNIPQLAVAMRKLMNELSRVPRVSQNLIDMTNALAKLARTGASSGRAATSLANVFDRIGNSSANAHRGINRVTLSLSGLFKKLLPVISLAKLFDLGKQSIEIASNLEDTQNVVDVTFGKYAYLVKEFEKKSIQEIGMGELNVRKIASRFQQLGTAVGVSREQMAYMSIELTRLTGELTSLYGGTFEESAKSLEAIFTGETESIRSRFGIDVTNATIQAYALKNGLDANVSSMSQLEKSLLRYAYVTERAGIANGDFVKTFYSWQNQTRMLTENLQKLAGLVGTVLINTFKPLIIWLNRVMDAVITAVTAIVNTLGVIFGWELEVTTPGSSYDDVSSGLDDIASSADGAGSSMGGAADKAKELQKALLGFDEINKLPDESSSSGGSGGSGGGGTGIGSGSGSGIFAEVVERESVFESNDALAAWLDNISKKAEPTTKALKKLWDEGLKKLANFTWTAAKDFYNNFLVPVGNWALGKGLPDLINATNNFLNNVDWDRLNKALERFWKALAPFATSIGDGLIRFYGDLLDFGANFLNKVVPGGLDALSSALESMDAETIEKIGYALGVLATSIAGIKITNTLLTNLESLLTLFGMGGNGQGGGLLGGVSILRLAFGLSVFNTIANEITGGPDALAEDIAGIIDEALGKVPDKGFPSLKKFSEWLRGILPWKTNENDETPEIEVGIDADTTEFETEVGSASEYLNATLPNETAVDVGANTKPATKSIDGLQDYTKNKALKIQKLSIPDSVNKKVFGLTEKYLTKNPVKLSTKIKESDSEMQKKLEKFKNLEVKTEVKTTTTAPVMQSALGQLVKNFTYSIPVKIGTAAQTIRSQFSGLFSGYTQEVDALANFKKKKDSLGELKTFETLAKFTKIKDDVPSAEKNIKGLLGYVSKTEKQKDKSLSLSGILGYVKETGKQKGYGLSLSGILGYVNETKKQSGATLTLSGIIGYIAKTLMGARQNADGGVYSGGSWKPITAYAGGGLPSQGQMFVAREAGPELVGTLGGHTAVMNNNQIVSSVSDGVYHAVAAAMSQFTGQMNGGGTPNITVYVGGRQVTDVVVEEVNQRTKATGMCPIMV